MDQVMAKAQGVWLLIFMLVIGILGVLLVVALAAMRRRFDRRMRQLQVREPSPPPADIWKISGQRLASQHEQAPDDDDENPRDEDDPADR
jgi:hypothetical protein